MARKGRSRKVGERYANGRLKPAKDTLAPTLVRRMLDEEMKGCSDPRFASQLGRLMLRGEILAAEYQAGLKFAEIYERTARNNGLKRSAKSPNWEIGSCGPADRRVGIHVRETAEETRDDPTPFELRAMGADKAYRNLCELLPMRQRFVLERLCVEDQALTSSDLLTARAGLEALEAHFGTGAAPKKCKKQPAKTAVPVVVPKRPAVKGSGATKASSDTDYLAEALHRLRPDVNLTHDLVQTIRCTPLVAVNQLFAARVSVATREGDDGAVATLVDLYEPTLHHDPACDRLR
jgi:hypothetical protein